MASSSLLPSRFPMQNWSWHTTFVRRALTLPAFRPWMHMFSVCPASSTRQAHRPQTLRPQTSGTPLLRRWPLNCLSPSSLASRFVTCDPRIHSSSRCVIVYLLGCTATGFVAEVCACVCCVVGWGTQEKGGGGCMGAATMPLCCKVLVTQGGFPGGE